jgi:starvation-inducible DNA-binding protein
MSQGDDYPFLHATRIDIPLEIRAYVTTMLNQILACTVELRSQVKQAAWNVKGNACIPLQGLFDAIAVELDSYTDLLAERITVLGGVVRGTIRMVAVQSTLPEYPEDIVEGHAHVRILVERFADYAKVMRSCIAHAADVEDADTANVCTDISRGVDKRLSLLEAYLYQ